MISSKRFLFLEFSFSLVFKWKIVVVNSLCPMTCLIMFCCHSKLFVMEIDRLFNSSFSCPQLEELLFSLVYDFDVVLKMAPQKNLISSNSFSSKILHENLRNFFIGVLHYLCFEYEHLTMDSMRSVSIDPIESLVGWVTSMWSETNLDFYSISSSSLIYLLLFPVIICLWKEPIEC